jgi:hypothetical protein
MANSRQQGYTGQNPFSPAPCTPGSLGINDCGDPSWSAIGDSPGSVGINDRAGMCIPTCMPSRPQRTFNVLLFDSLQLARFFRSCAYLRFVQQGMGTEYKEEKSLFFTIVYKVMFGGLKGVPGTVEVTMADESKVQSRTDAKTAEDMTTFLQKCAAGPLSAISFLKGREELRDGCYADIQSTFADAQQLNREIIQETATGITRLAAIKASSTIVLKVAEKFAPPGLSTAISLGYDLALDIVKDLNSSEAKNANLIGIVSGAAGKNIASDKLKKTAEKPIENWEKGLKAQAEKLEKEAEEISDRMEKQATRLADETRPKAINRLTTKLAKNESKLLQTSQTLSKTAAKLKIAKGLGWVFTAKDVFEAVQDFRETVAAAEL